MVFSSLSFLYVFLPLVLLLFYILPRKFGNLLLLLASLALYFVGEQMLVLVMLLSALVSYLCGIIISSSGKKSVKTAALVFSAVSGVLLLGYFKYADFFITSFNSIFGTSGELLKIALPVGISFYTFQSMSYVIDVYKGDIPAERNFINLATYITFFPQLIAGPIVRYSDISHDLFAKKHKFSEFSVGVRRFVLGLSKKVLLANSLAALVKTITYSSEKSVLFLWMSAFAFLFQIYFDFSGYSDMAIGLGLMFGFHFPENFNYPYISASIGEFWRRWHISLGRWFRDYVYIPLGGNRKGYVRWIVNVLIVWALTGLWHGAEWNFVLWGLLYGLILIIEKAVSSLTGKKTNRIFGTIYTLFFVTIGFVIFSANDLPSALNSLKGMFGLNSLSLSGIESLYYLRNYAVLFVISAIGATPLLKKITGKLSRKITDIAEPIVLCVLLLLCTGYLIDGSFNPFLYFRF